MKKGKRALQSRNVMAFNIFLVDKLGQTLGVLACPEFNLEV